MNALEKMLKLPNKRFDWFKALKWCKRYPHLVREGLGKQLVFRAIEWPTCACGQLCRGILKNSRGIPDDDTLMHYGQSFLDKIRHSDWSDALEVMARIESRTAELLALHKSGSGPRDRGELEQGQVYELTEAGCPLFPTSDCQTHHHHNQQSSQINQ